MAVTSEILRQRDAGLAFSVRIIASPRSSPWQGEWSVAARMGKDDVMLTGQAVRGFPFNSRLIIKGSQSKRSGKSFFNVEDFLLNVSDRGTDEIRFLKKKLAEAGGFSVQWVSRWTSDRVEKMVKNPEAIKAEFGIGDGQVERWRRALVENRLRRVLKAAGVGKEGISNISDYNDEAQEVWTLLTTNPWKLALEVEKVPFLSMDLIASTFNLPRNAPERFAAGLAHVLKEMGNDDGGTIHPKEKALTMAQGMLGTEREGIFNHALEQGAVVEVEKGWLGEAVIVKVESDISRLVKRMVKETKVHLDKTAVREVVERTGLDDEQSQAVTDLLQSPIGILTGGPGTGKTTVLGAITEILQKENRRVTLMAPTGKAATRLSQVTAGIAGTIHHTLGSKKFGVTGTWIVDECSMIASDIMLWLLKMASDHMVQLILVGDADQLPPIDSGIPFCDLINSQYVKTIYLERIYRQDEESGIPVAAACIRQGKLPQGLGGSPNTPFVKFIRVDDSQMLADQAIEAARGLKEKYGDDEGVVLTSINKGEAGVQGLGERLQQDHTGWVAEEIVGRGHRWRPGDPVIHTRNDYGAQGGTLYQGTMGRIKEVAVGVFDGDGVVTILWDDGVERQHDVEDGEIDNVLLAYSLTVHRSQGSEYDGVTLVLPERGAMVTSRELVYTGVTRAKREVVVLYQGEMLQKALIKVHGRRETALQRFLAAPEVAITAV